MLESLLYSDAPDIVHMHSVFVPKQATLARNIVQRKIPYVITPNGGLDSLRGWAKKIVYSLIAQKRRFYEASAITVVTPKEEKTVRTFAPRYSGIIRWVANPFDTCKLGEQNWKGNVGVKRLVYLGRFDVLHKGIDILVEIARLLPEIEFHLYGTEDSKTKRWLERIRRNCPSNVHFHKPVFGVHKFQVLADASLYIQTSRWEGFPLSIAEAMHLGLPCAVGDMPNFAELYSLSKVDFLKMDIEGIEFAILMNCSHSLLKKVKRIALEYHPELGSLDALIEHLQAIGFQASSWQERRLLYAWRESK